MATLNQDGMYEPNASSRGVGEPLESLDGYHASVVLHSDEVEVNEMV